MTDCFRCGKDLMLSGSPGRGDTCSNCLSDIKVCLNCRFHDPAFNNECRETQAERVVDKGRANFCEHFALREGPLGKGPQKDPLEALKALFKD